ncbi:adenosylcobinamide-phosphate synthase CbiB [Romboutsia sp. 1001216sp1]|uniref:adenosylcobinamide-phosphate synthase CbiB n=1 Tax=unclassified Romboutsia TaxID=2626894 RepID=UPI00189F9432|nr:MULTISPECIES: adenosylcobinamide-phosphate synthase CbiB [unclassified Romboutsia]MDB8791228.1 adenosylcobinamide-phosphate synthase CbiB [Romboutsia sp. 1001216sp1]MDB8794769.1 adenosylcobinamide-phosphate synthase CbiB [Romboutsia sp. 1001216sp1]MDB8797618.1 adenosylcobinamide-phosphate synthase CbiB [Romboutsia sp. 1001216sp1]MDB8800461.1 adenosylcobinamide-phosphate synthase CbiB [Romboutsia sp. 1001216sp1]MDB8803373.1 adenosylcobinamide-phosphate synthase CbiB [Romboutsia sp. 1001216sp
MNILSIYIGYIIDLIVGDPYSFPHPVRYIGKLIKKTESIIRKKAKSDKALKTGGFFLWFIVVGITYLFTYLIIKLSSFIPGGFLVTNSILIYTTLATKCLKDEAVKIYNVLKTGDIEKARIQVSYIVGRDTTQLNEGEIIRATVETVAENTVDGIIAPMFYAFIGGAPLAMAYKAINTLDSTVGYKNEKYKDLGFASAKIDDIANFIPARISVLLMSIGSLLVGHNCKEALKIGIRDRKNHKSPNCAYAEGTVAGALGVQLGGTNIYFGKAVYKPTIGDKHREIEVEDIVRTNKIMYASSITSMIVFTIIFILL